MWWKCFGEASTLVVQMYGSSRRRDRRRKRRYVTKIEACTNLPVAQMCLLTFDTVFTVFHPELAEFSISLFLFLFFV